MARSKYYSIYLKKTDELVASGTYDECMKALGITNMNRFYSLVSKNIHGVHNKYDIFIEELSDIKDEEE